jgi:hypothetical protein
MWDRNGGACIKWLGVTAREHKPLCPRTSPFPAHIRLLATFGDVESAHGTQPSAAWTASAHLARRQGSTTDPWQPVTDIQPGPCDANQHDDPREGECHIPPMTHSNDDQPDHAQERYHHIRPHGLPLYALRHGLPPHARPRCMWLCGRWPYLSLRRSLHTS